MKWQQQLKELTKSDFEETDEKLEEDRNSENEGGVNTKSRANSKSIDLGSHFNHEQNLMLLIEDPIGQCEENGQGRGKFRDLKKVNLEEIEGFLYRNGLQYLLNNFDGSQTLKELAKLPLQDLQNIVEGEMYIWTDNEWHNTDTNSQGFLSFHLPD